MFAQYEIIILWISTKEYVVKSIQIVISSLSKLCHSPLNRIDVISLKRINDCIESMIVAIMKMIVMVLFCKDKCDSYEKSLYEMLSFSLPQENEMYFIENELGIYARENY